MDSKDLLLPLVVALWGCATLVLELTKEINKQRDKILHGEEAGRTIPVAMRELMMHNDWLPHVVCVISLTLGFGLVAGLSPFLLKAEDRDVSVWLCSGFVGGFSFVMNIAWLVTARVDWRVMKTAVREASGQQTDTNFVESPG